MLTIGVWIIAITLVLIVVAVTINFVSGGSDPHTNGNNYKNWQE